jgi:uncharacterized LabA/DUF88 family protein
MSSPAPTISPQRTSVYIDGYNLYHGMLDGHGRKYLWLDLRRFALSLFSDPRQQLVAVKYFTSAAPGGPQTAQRQQTYWKALETCADLEIIRGKYREMPTRCKSCGIKEAICRDCGEKLSFRNEKRTDVNIATHLVRDACENRFDVAILVGGDTDLIAAVEVVKSLRRIVVAFPPNRTNDEMRRAASGSFVLTEAKFKNAQFLNDRVEVASGIWVERPIKWR